MLAPPLRSRYLMNDIPRGTTLEEILRSLTPPVHTDPQLNYELIRGMLGNEPVFRDSELDDSLSVTTIEFNDTPEWLRFLSGISHGFPLKTKFGTIWGAVDMTSAGKDTQGRTAFIRAIMTGDLKYAEMLAEYAEADVTSPDKRGRTALHWACEKQLSGLINLCLAVPGLDSGMRDKDNLTAFDISCRAEDEAIPALFYKNIFELEKTNPDGALLRLLTVSSESEEGSEFPGEALFGPIVGNRQPLVEALMNSGVNLTATNSDHETALHLAAKHGHAEIVAALLENSSRGARVDAEAVNKDGLTALHYAAQQGHGQVVKVLLNLGADKEAKDSNGRTARDRAAGNDDIQAALDLGSDDQTTLHRAAAEGRAERVQQLLDRGAVLEGTNRQGMTALHCAAGGDRAGTVELLLGRGAELEAKDNSSQTALHCAAENGHTETVKLLLDRGAVLEGTNRQGMTALHCAAGCGRTGTVKLLLGRGAELEAKDNSSQTALHCAAENGHTETVKLLLDRGAELGAKDSDLHRALDRAAKNGHNGTVKLLLDRGAELEAKDASLQTALHSAVRNGRAETVKLLLYRGALVITKDASSKTALHSAAENGHTETVKLLLDRGAVVKAKDWALRTALHSAAENGHTETVELLLDRGALVGMRDASSQTALHSAAENGHTETVKLLLDRGAVLEVKDKTGKTALHLARKSGHSTLATFLQELGSQST